MFKQRLLGVALGAAMMVAAGVASGNSLTILPGSGSVQEHTGDPSGSVYPYSGGPGPGAGVPWRNPSNGTGWPDGPGFSLDTSFPPFTSTSGFDTSYLRLDSAGRVTFQFMGAGDSSIANSFWIDLNGDAAGGWTQMFQDGGSTGPTNPCPVTPNGAKFPSCDRIAPGLPDGINLTYNQYTILLDPANFAGGLIPFAYDIGGLGGPINNTTAPWTWNGLTSSCPGAIGNPPDVPPTGGSCPGFFLGVDPYLATAPHQLTGQAVYAGLSDRPRSANGVAFDHDYQDMGVRISVPEPGSLALLGLGLAGLAGMRRRKLN